MFKRTSITSPNKIEFLNNGFYYYNYDIQEEEQVTEQGANKVYTAVQVKCSGRPEYKKCIKAIIRAYLTEEQELNIINNYNSYQQGINDDQNAVEEYYNYLNIVKDIKEKVYKDFDVVKKVTDAVSPRQVDLLKFINLVVNSITISDNDSLKIKSLYPDWNEFINKSLSAGTKIRYNNRLYKVRQEIATVLDLDGYRPSDITVAALYEEINETHGGTLEDPIPYNTNMELFKDKYYIQDGIIYKCIRDSEQPLYHPLAQLVGLYVEVAE